MRRALCPIKIITSLQLAKFASSHSFALPTFASPWNNSSLDYGSGCIPRNARSAGWRMVCGSWAIGCGRTIGSWIAGALPVSVAACGPTSGFIEPACCRPQTLRNGFVRGWAMRVMPILGACGRIYCGVRCSWGRRPDDRVLRGGSWNNRPNNTRSAKRNRNNPDNRNNNTGFRVASTALRFDMTGTCESRAIYGSHGRAAV